MRPAVHRAPRFIRLLALRTARLTFVALLLIANDLQADKVVLDAGGFEAETIGESPAKWLAFPAKRKPSVVVVGVGDGSRQSIRGQRSESAGLTALSRDFTSPQRRVMIEFSFAFSAGGGRSLNLWTHEPNGRDASQFNLCIQGGALLQFDGRTRTWEEITRNIQPTD